MIRLAVIGMGGRATGLIHKAKEMGLSFSLSAVVDPTPEAVRERLRKRELNGESEPPVFGDIDQMLASGAPFDGIVLGTRCNTHAPLAVQLAEAGVDVPLLLEKPVAVSEEQLAQLAQAYEGRGDKVVVSFPLRITPLLQKVREIVRSGRLGAINQIQAYNNVSYGGVYFGNWYRDFDTTGGLWLQKATHDFDYINALVDRPPMAVAAMHSQRVFGGDKPESLRCSECDQTETCLESPQNIEQRGSDGGMGRGDHWCAFSESIRNQDAGSAMIMYEGGVHAAYSQNFVTRRSAHQRGARITGYKATLEFDWTKDRLWITEHHGEECVTEMPVSAAGGHGGGDDALVQNFFDIIRGEDTSHTPLKEGLLSAAMCLAARKSATTWTFQPIVQPGATAQSEPLAPPQAVEV